MIKLKTLLTEDIIPGGKGDNKTVEDIAKKHNVSVDHIKKQIEIGIQIEHEHVGKDDAKAKEIACDHLWENGDYYIKLVQSGIVDEKDALDLFKKYFPDKKINEQEIEGKNEISPELQAKIIQFIKNHPNLDDSDFHKFVEDLGIDPHEAEEVVYRNLQNKLNTENKIMKKSELEKLIEQRLNFVLSNKRKLHEDRLSSDFAEYAVKANKITVFLKAQKAGVFTKAAKQWKEMNEKVKKLAEQKRILNDIKNEVEEIESEVKAIIKEEIPKLVDVNEQSMTIAVECAGSTFTLSELTEQNKDTVIPSQTIEQPDYEKAWKAMVALMEGNDGMLAQMDAVLKQNQNVITIAEQILKGKERAIRIKLKENGQLTELSISDAIGKVKQFFTNQFNKLKSLLSKNKSKVNNYSAMVNKLK